MLRKRSQTKKKATYYIIPFFKLSRISKSVEIENRLVVARVWGEKEMWNDCLKGMEFSFGMKKMFWN